MALQAIPSSKLIRMLTDKQNRENISFKSVAFALGIEGIQGIYPAYSDLASSYLAYLRTKESPEEATPIAIPTLAAASALGDIYCAGWTTRMKGETLEQYNQNPLEVTLRWASGRFDDVPTLKLFEKYIGLSGPPLLSYLFYQEEGYSLH